MTRFFRALPRKFFSITWPVGLLVVLAVVAASCSGGQDQAQLVDPEDSPTAPVADFVEGDVPDVLAFEDDELTLRLSVPNLPVVTSHGLAETDPVQVVIADLLSDGLTQRNPVDGSIEPAVAESWIVSPDGLRWTFQLGEATFSDGSLIAADDVVASLTRVAVRGAESVSGPNLWPIVGWMQAGEIAQGDPTAVVDVPGLQAVADDQVEITLSEPFAPLAEVLAGVIFGVLPADAVDSTSVSSGVEFALDMQWADGMRFVGPIVDGQISAIELLVDPGLTMLRAGETDLGVGFDAASGDGFSPLTVARSASSYFAMNATAEPFSDPLIRQAVVRAIDVDALRLGQFPEAAPMRSFIPVAVGGNGDGGGEGVCGASCVRDIEQARTLVEASQSTDVAITVDFIAEASDDEQAVDGEGQEVVNAEERMALSIVEDLEAVGLTAVAVPHSAEEYAAAAAAGELGLFRFGSISTTLSAEAFVGLPFHSDGSDNLTGTSIDRVDELIDEARRTDDGDVRAELYSDAERILLAEAVVVPLVEFQHLVLLGETLESAGLEPDGSLNLAEVEFAELEAPILQGE